MAQDVNSECCSGKRLQEICAESGQDAQTIATHCEVPATLVEKWLDGRATPKGFALKRLSTLVRRSEGYILWGTSLHSRFEQVAVVEESYLDQYLEREAGEGERYLENAGGGCRYQGVRLAEPEPEGSLFLLRVRSKKLDMVSPGEGVLVNRSINMGKPRFLGLVRFEQIEIGVVERCGNEWWFTDRNDRKTIEEPFRQLMGMVVQFEPRSIEEVLEDYCGDHCRDQVCEGSQ